MVSPPEAAAGTSTGGSWITSSCAPESTRTVASGRVSGPGPRRAARSATRKRTARMPAAPGVEVRTTYRLACVLATAGRLLPECRVRAFLVGHEHGYWRQDHDRNRERRARRDLRRGPPPHAPGSLRPLGGHGHRDRDGCRGPGAPVRALLHHPRSRLPQRARPRDGLWGGEEKRRIRVGVQRAGTGHEREDLPAPAAHVRLPGGGHRAASNARTGARVSAEAVQRRGAGAEGPGGEIGRASCRERV